MRFWRSYTTEQKALLAVMFNFQMSLLLHGFNLQRNFKPSILPFSFWDMSSMNMLSGKGPEQRNQPEMMF